MGSILILNEYPRNGVFKMDPHKMEHCLSLIFLRWFKLLTYFEKKIYYNNVFLLCKFNGWNKYV